MNIKNPDSANGWPRSIKDALFNEYTNGWYMTEAERCTFIMLLEKIRPECAVEVGTYEGGSLSVLSRYSKKVYTLDFDETCSERLGQNLTNVEFVTGRSQDTLPPLLQRLQENGDNLGFVLIDAEHTRDGVKRDIENLIKFVPTQPLYVVMHDSFNPNCRQGIRDANWASSPYVHFVELDFVGGQFPTDPNYYRQMWCGFAIALMLPTKRKGDLDIHANEELLFQTILKNSVYPRYSKFHPMNLIDALRRRMWMYGKKHLLDGL